MEVKLGDPHYALVGSGVKRRPVLHSDKLYYVPLRKTLQSLYSHPQLRQILLKSHASTDGVLRDFCDATYVTKHPLFSVDPRSIQIIAYFDEVEVCNALGSSAKKHKLGVVYFTLGNIPPKFRSSLKVIHLALVVKVVDIKKHGIDLVLAPFVNDLILLASEGVSVDFGGEKTVLRGSLLAFLGDNIGSHCVGGFKESFTLAYRFCRSCLATRKQSQEHFKALAFETRTPEMYETHCDLLKGPLTDHNSVTYGINRKALLESVPNFSVTTGLPHDVMHDLFEGVVGYEIKPLLVHCIMNGYFSIKEFNRRLRSFDYGYSETDKPAPIDDSLLSKDSGGIRQTAKQMWLLCRVLPLLVGDCIPVEDMHWHCFTLLLKVVDICTTHECTANTAAYLSVLIEEHHSLFKEVYPDLPVLPKHHFMTHYPEQILRYGPLIHSWTMRHEAKNKFSKQVARFGNFKNICYSVAQKHQQWMCYMLQNPSCFDTKIELGGICRSKPIENEPESFQAFVFSQLSYSATDGLVIRHPQRVTYCHSEFRISCFVMLSMETEPVFGKVMDMLVMPDNTMYFYVLVYVTNYFDSHYHSYAIRPSADIYKYVTIPCLAKPFIFHAFKTFERTNRFLYIVPKYGIVSL